MNLRIPYWAKSGGVVSVNGQHTANTQLKAHSLRSLNRKWNDGDTLELSLPMPLHLHAMPDDGNLVALMVGPVVLAGLSDDELTYKGTPAQLIDAVKPVEGKPLTYALESAGKTITFKPLYRVVDESYGVYVRTGK